VEKERERAFIAVHRDSYPRVYRYVRRRVESAELAEELAADVFRVVWQKWGDQPRTDIAWLLTVARNLIGNAYRSRDRLQALQAKLRASAQLRSGAESEDMVVHDALAALRDSERDILQMAYWDELSTAEIAGVPSNILSAGPCQRLRRPSRATGGPVCPEPKPFQTLDSVVVDIPQKADKLREFPHGPSAFVFRIIQGDKVYGSLALADGELAPKAVTCGLYNGILGPDNVPLAHFGDTEWLTADGRHAPHTFDSVAAAKAYMQTQEYQDVKRMLISLALQPAA
jgi:RNA polymerase sigma-70 factor (ECF subfamily)